MDWYVAITICAAMVLRGANAPPPLRLTIDCGSDDTPVKLSSKSLYPKPPSVFADSGFNVDAFCRLIHNAIPKVVKDGKFILIEPDDQATFADTQVPVAIAPPKGFAVPRIGMHKLRLPKLKVPKINVPSLRSAAPDLQAPIVSSPVLLPLRRDFEEEESSSERMEKFKKGIQKLLHVVKVLGQVDQYVSERARIVVDKLAKSFDR